MIDKQPKLNLSKYANQVNLNKQDASRLPYNGEEPHIFSDKKSNFVPLKAGDKGVSSSGMLQQPEDFNEIGRDKIEARNFLNCERRQNNTGQIYSQ